MRKTVILFFMIFIFMGCSANKTEEEKIYSYFSSIGYQCNNNECLLNDTIEPVKDYQTVTNRTFSYNKITNTFKSTTETTVFDFFKKTEIKINFNTKKAEINDYINSDFYTASYDLEKGEYIRYPEKDSEFTFSILKEVVEEIYYDVMDAINKN